MLAGAWSGASGMACAALPDSPKMKAKAINLFTGFSLRCCFRTIMSQAVTSRKERIRSFPFAFGLRFTRLSDIRSM
jgi:hypothetical protein